MAFLDATFAQQAQGIHQVSSCIGQPGYNKVSRHHQLSTGNICEPVHVTVGGGCRGRHRAPNLSWGFTFHQRGFTSQV